MTTGSAALGFPSLPLTNVACQYPPERHQHDWRNAQFATNYNMFQQAGYNPSPQDNRDYSAIFDANYALAQAQMVNKSRESDSKDGILGGSSSGKNGEWMNFQDGGASFSGDIFGQQAQYSVQHQNKNYWA